MADKNRDLKDKLYEQFARIGQATSSPKRLELLDLLAQGERTVEALAEATQLTIGNTSRHLRVLREARLVEGRKDGLYVFYRLAGPEVFAFYTAVKLLAQQRLAEVGDVLRRYLGNRDELQPVSRKELRERMRSGECVVLDVRPAQEYRAGHIPGALSLPVGELKRRLRELPKRKEIIAYCRGPYCVYSYEAVEVLRASGRSARRLVDGLPEWRAAGLPVETSNEAAS